MMLNKEKQIFPKNNDKFSSARKLLVSEIKRALGKCGRQYTYVKYKPYNICLYKESNKIKLLVNLAPVLPEYKPTGFSTVIGEKGGEPVNYTTPSKFFSNSKVRLLANIHVANKIEELLNLDTDTITIKLPYERRHDFCFLGKITARVHKKDYSWHIEMPKQAIEILESINREK